MTDRELSDRTLLELAAKAIGGTLSEGHTKVRTGETWADWKWIGEPGIVTPASWKPYGNVVIHPLTDDGDALRLAVKLKVSVLFEFDRVIACYGDDDHEYETEFLYEKPSPTDPYAATRRAIVRAAAEIGKQMA